MIPEFDMPGHAHAAIKAMESRNESQYMLSDPADNSTYLSVQYFTDNAINPCTESTYNFIEHVVKAVVDMHRNISDLKSFHFGGDEQAESAWIDSPICLDKYPKVNDTKEENEEWITERKKEFVYRVANITAAHGLDLGGWEDGLMHAGIPYVREDIRNTHVFANTWNNVWEWGDANRAYKLANAGYQVLFSLTPHYHFCIKCSNAGIYTYAQT